jgi:hypothetical protein
MNKFLRLDFYLSNTCEILQTGSVSMGLNLLNKFTICLDTCNSTQVAGQCRSCKQIVALTEKIMFHPFFFSQ